MSRIAIVFSPLHLSRDFIDYPYFADLGAVQNAAVLRKAGHRITLIDALALPGAQLRPEDKGKSFSLGAPLGTLLSRLPKNADAYIFALTPFHRPPSRDPGLSALLEAARAHRPSAPIVLADLYQSGQHVIDAPPEQILAAYPEAHAFLRYEAEAALPALIARLLEPGPPQSPFVEEGPEPAHLDELPLPAWDLLELDAYFELQQNITEGLGRPHWAFPITGRSLPMLSSRGCPYRCIHCSSNPSTRKNGELIAPKTQRRYSKTYLKELIAYLKRLGAGRIHLLDELINVNERHFDDILDLFNEIGLPFEIPNGMRADYILPKHISSLKKHITTLSISAESGSERVLSQIVDKQMNLSHIRRAAEYAQTESLPTLVHFMIGLPGETKREINETLNYAMELHENTNAWPSLQFATPLPGTRLSRESQKIGRILPMINDFGPHFQQRPSIETPEFSLDDLKRFRFTFEQRLKATQGPKKVILNVTYKCNNRCTFCATGTRSQFDGDLGRQRELLLKYRKLGVTLLDFDGGEPTLNPNLFVLIQFARKIGYKKINVTTNARMCAYPEFAERLIRSGIHTLLISVHGPDANTHAQNVGVAEAFDQTITGIRNLVAAEQAARKKGKAIVELGANITITKSNTKKLLETAELIESLGLRWFNLQFLTPFGRATSSIAPDTQMAAQEAMRLIDTFGKRLNIQVINLPFCFMPGYERYLMGDMLKLERHMLFVNNEEVNLFEYLRERRTKKDVCESCPHAIFCGGFYEMDDVPEPAWLIRPEDLIRPIREDIPRPSIE